MTVTETVAQADSSTIEDAAAGDTAAEGDAAEGAVVEAPQRTLADGLIEEELRVEEISIDGMCGVY
ncbi:MAG: mycofactocin precursor MftA [Acidimicrobiales bacterium]